MTTIDYHIKFTACLLIFYLFYRLVLERESIHTFKRYYLLFCILVAGLIPLIPLHSTPVIQGELILQSVSGSAISIHVEQTDPNPIDWDQLILAIYFAGVGIMGGRYIINLGKLYWRIRKHPLIIQEDSIKVLVDESVIPHTFMSYVFLNKDLYLNNQIPEEVITHEEAHVRQKHSADVFLLEFLQVVLWFNPLIYLISSSVKLNHEFLADKSVITQGLDYGQYCETLLTFGNSKNRSSLVNAFNYSSIKKRLLIMKKRTTQTEAGLRQIGALFILVLALYSFSSSTDLSEIKPDGRSPLAPTQPRV